MSSDWLFLLDSEWSIPPGSNTNFPVTQTGIYLSLFTVFILLFSNNIIATPATMKLEMQIIVPLVEIELLIKPVKLLIIVKIIPNKQIAKIALDNIL